MIRRRLASRWPALSHWFGLRPWHVDRLTPAELAMYERALDDIQKQQSAPAGRAGPKTRRR